jgi:hypothetical protein
MVAFAIDDDLETLIPSGIQTVGDVSMVPSDGPAHLRSPPPMSRSMCVWPFLLYRPPALKPSLVASRHCDTDDRRLFRR